jgi:hypothetical protein
VDVVAAQLVPETRSAGPAIPSAWLNGTSTGLETSLPASINIKGSKGLFSSLVLRHQASGADYRVGLILTGTKEVLIPGQTHTGTSVFADADTGLPSTSGCLRPPRQCSPLTTYAQVGCPAARHPSKQGRRMGRWPPSMGVMTVWGPAPGPWDSWWRLLWGWILVDSLFLAWGALAHIT